MYVNQKESNKLQMNSTPQRLRSRYVYSRRGARAALTIGLTRPRSSWSPKTIVVLFRVPDLRGTYTSRLFKTTRIYSHCYNMVDCTHWCFESILAWLGRNCQNNAAALLPFHISHITSESYSPVYIDARVWCRVIRMFITIAVTATHEPTTAGADCAFF
jgi:hypothetical protein